MDEIVSAWKEYMTTLNSWEDVISGVTPKMTQCGPIYEPLSPLPKRTETFAISDMRGIKIALPHYHTNGETEIYFVIQGSGITVVGGEEILLKKDVIVVIPPDTTHFTIPKSDLVMMVINTPSFKAANIVEPADSDPRIKFDKKQYNRLVQNIT